MTATVTPAAASRTASASQASAARPARTRSLASLYVRLALLLYPLYAVLTPAFETPDEHSHLFRAYQLSRCVA